MCHDISNYHGATFVPWTCTIKCHWPLLHPGWKWRSLPLFPWLLSIAKSMGGKLPKPQKLADRVFILAWPLLYVWQVCVSVCECVCVCVCVCARTCFHAHLLAKSLHSYLTLILWTIALQGPLSMGFSRQEYWSRLPFPISFQPRDWTSVSCIPCIGRQVLYH